MITFQRESLCQVVDEIDTLLKLHYQELTLNKDKIKLNPRWNEYAMLESLGRISVYTARDAGKLVGYSAFFVHHHLHYSDTIVAINDVLFLHPDHRKGTTGVRLIRFCEQDLRLQDVQKIVWHAKVDTNLERLMPLLGYRVEDVMYGKML